MAGKKPRLTKNQAEWEKQYNLLKRRISDWKRKFHAVFNELPIKPSRITKKDIERLKEITWKKLTPQQKESARREYTYRYDEEWEDVYEPKLPYTPPTEQDFYNNLDYGEDYDTEWEEQHPGWDEEAIDTEAELNQWITNLIEQILDVNVNYPTPGIEQTLRGIMYNSEDRMGKEEFYNFLQENASQLHQLAERAISGYLRRGSSPTRLQEGAMVEFATILNMNRPLTQEQSETLTQEGYIDFDYSELQ